MWQPLSAISSLFYSIVGLFILRRRPITGLVLIGLGLSSAAFHWTANSIWHSTDVIFIFLIFNVIIANFLYKGFLMPRSVLVPSVIIVTAIMAYFEPIINSVIVIGGQFAVLCFITRYFQRHQLYIWIFGIALIFNIPHITAFELSQLWHDLTHTIWHSLTAYGFYKIMKIEIEMPVALFYRKNQIDRLQEKRIRKTLYHHPVPVIKFWKECKLHFQSLWFRTRRTYPKIEKGGRKNGRYHQYNH